MLVNFISPMQNEVIIHLKIEKKKSTSLTSENIKDILHMIVLKVILQYNIHN